MLILMMIIVITIIILIMIITLGNNDFAVWDISTDSTLLGVTDTRMNSHFARSGLIFPLFYVFE